MGIEQLCEKKGLIYHAGDDQNRYILASLGGPNPIICFGVNPSKAGTVAEGKPDAFQLDRTMGRIQSLIDKKDTPYDGWIMLNLYPQRTGYPDELDADDSDSVKDRLAANYSAIQMVLKEFPKAHLWAAWGNIIDTRRYLREALRVIAGYSEGRQWMVWGGLTQMGNPRHPLYVRGDENLEPVELVADIRLVMK